MQKLKKLRRSLYYVCIDRQKTSITEINEHKICDHIQELIYTSMERDGVFHKSQNNEKKDRLMKKSTIACVEIVSEGHYLVVLLSVTE